MTSFISTVSFLVRWETTIHLKTCIQLKILYSTVISITCSMKPVSYLDLVLTVPCWADTTTGLSEDSFSLLWPLKFPWVSKEKASTSKFALKVNSFRLGPVKVERKFYKSPPSKCFPSCAFLSRHKKRSIQVHTEWHTCAWGQRQNLKNYSLYQVD